jgi:Zn-dependent M16 (insulinase) family peptidase
MKILLRWVVLTLLLTLTMTLSAAADEFLEGLQPDEVVHGFKVLNLYDNASGQAMGARFISEKNGFIVDLMQIQSVPQAFYWIKTPVTASRGEPHACEHLLLGKGNRGRYVASLEDMALGNSTAYTEQYRTCYHFNTTAGEDTFYEIFEAKLQALLRPDFTDEEIRREVCHLGVVDNPQDGSLSLDEKGTVYTEMVSSYERPYYNTYRKLYQMVYGEDHPLTHSSGGNPDVMRDMVPQDMWDFHGATHHLANMGSIVSIPTSIPVDGFLKQMSATLDRCQEHPDSSPLPGIGNFDFPPPTPAPLGSTMITSYPSDRAEDPGYLLYSWPADLDLNYREEAVLELFLEVFGSGETSDLYDVFINSETRQIDIDADAVDGWIEDDFGLPISFDLTGVNSAMVNQETLDKVRDLILAAVDKVRGYADGSEELEEFNTRARNRMIELRKQVANNLNRPPMFGFRSGPAGAWLSMMDDLEDTPGFRKSLVYEEHFGYVDSLLALDKNIWRERIDTWRLLTVPPYAVGAIPGTDIVQERYAAKQARLAAHIEDFKVKYGVDDTQAALASYKADFDATTAELEAGAAELEMPGFIDNPPMTLDDQLDYQTITLEGGIPLVASTFENMSSSRVGIALRLDVIPEEKMMYVPFLPSVLTSIGVVKDGEIVKFEDMQERLRLEVLNLNTSYSSNFQKGRVELVLRGEGSNLEELQNALGWMSAALYSPYLSPDNLPRISDRIDQLIQANRNRVRGSEEQWVGSPQNGYRFQKNPLVMASNCFFTRTHLLQRLKWLLTDPGDATTRGELTSILEQLEQTGDGLAREELAETLGNVESVLSDPDVEAGNALAERLKLAGEPVQDIVKDIIASLRTTLGDIPDANLNDDWHALCGEIKADLLVSPKTTLGDLSETLSLISRADNARMFMISNSADREASMAKMGQLVAGLSTEPSTRQAYTPVLRVTQRMASREPGLEHPLYVGLVHQATQNGVLMFNARNADEYDTTSAALTKCLAGKLYGGGGPHGLFMKTWAAGLAYSNGYNFSYGTGRVSYYAERCPDVAETMRFVVGELKNAGDDPELTDYAIAQIFGLSRSPNRYEQRGEAMAANLADGITPEKVRLYRQKILEMRTREGLYENLKAHMETAYGPVLIGFGDSLAESEDGAFFMIGPEKQFESLEEYIATVEGEQTVYRLYPRDFWLSI